MTLTNRPAKSVFWIVAANEAKATFYTQDIKRSPLRAFLSVENESGRMKKGELLADRGGRSFDSFGAGRHTMAVEKTDPRKQAAATFAKKIAQRIGRATHDGTCRGFALIAAPRFLGMLREEVSRKCKFGPSKTIDKDVVGQDTVILQRLVDQP